MKLEIRGVDPLKSKVRAMTNKIRAAIRRGSRAGCKLIQAYAWHRVPQVTGALVQSLRVRALPRSRRWIGTQLQAQIRYASFVELGTKKKKGRWFIRDSSQAKRTEVERLIADEIKGAVNEP